MWCLGRMQIRFLPPDNQGIYSSEYTYCYVSRQSDLFSGKYILKNGRDFRSQRSKLIQIQALNLPYPNKTRSANHHLCRVRHLHQIESVGRSRPPRHGAVFGLNNCFKLIETQSALPDLDHRPDNGADHTPQKPIGPDVERQPVAGARIATPANALSVILNHPAFCS